MPTNMWQHELSPTQAPLSYPGADAVVFSNVTSGRPPPAHLHISQDGNKSRVETQICIRLTLDPMPPGVTKLHLPTHTVSKPKLLAKEIIKAPDTLELHTSLVCASAMDKPELCKIALKRAAGYESNTRKSQPRRPSKGDMTEDNPDDPDKPSNGAEVRICQNCVQRERKRAARKRVKKQEDEEAWAEYEYERVIVFNDKEYKDWGAPAPPKQGEINTPAYPPSAMQIEVPMRIACYCRHQGEKNGFR
ncbi:SPT3 Dosage dependent suppressor of Ty-induced promoter mutations-like protein [Diplodia seriata]